MTSRRSLAALAALALAGPALAQESIVSTKHNLSVSGPGPIKAQSESQICIFCHVPHHALGADDNRPNSTATYQPYNSTTLVSPPPGAPNGTTRICLSCHDGTIALGQTVASGTLGLLNTGPGGTLPAGATNVGTDLRLSHPVSFAPGASPQLRAPPAGDPVKLDKAGRVECTSCHDPHQDGLDPVQKKFLVKPNRASAICLSCHVKAYWLGNPSSHESSTATFNTALGATTPYTTVGDNGCESCHRPHSAATTSRLLKSQPPQNCLLCHNGSVAQKNIEPDFTKPYAHPVLTSNPAQHDAAESPTSPTWTIPETRSTTPRHVQCVDCHNPHAATRLSAVAPNANGFLSGVWGFTRDGTRADAAQYEYEICFKCHADSANQPQARGPTPPETVQRAFIDVNLRHVFDLTAPSCHPIEGPGRGVDVPSLVSPWTTASTVYCSDCHASDSGPGAGGMGPRGPHGSTWPHILERSFSTADQTPESPTAYALCYKCHDRNVLLDPKRSAFRLHQLHVVGERAPCSACHDWHGVSTLQGNPTNNAHLIDFDVSIVRANSRGLRQYATAGARTGTCSLTCHNEEHEAARYSGN